MPTEGVLVLDKPPGITSRQAAATVGRLAGNVKSGHTGTLDPLATGVLVVCLGRATLLTRFLSGGAKEYEAVALLGIDTDTYDVDGAVVQKRDTSGLGLEEINAVTNDFEGRIQQLPPPFSAVKHKGRPMYQYARAGVDIEQRPRTVNIESVEVTSLSDADNQVRFGIKIICGPGTYVRSLVHDIGERLGCGACVAELRRLRSGIFSIEQAISLDKLDSAEIDITKSILSVEKATEGMPSVQVGEEGAIAVGQGKPLQLEWVSDVLSEDRGIPRCTFRVLDSAGMLLAIYGTRRAEDGQEIVARPIRVLRPLTLETGENEAARAY